MEEYIKYLPIVVALYIGYKATSLIKKLFSLVILILFALLIINR